MDNIIGSGVESIHTACVFNWEKDGVTGFQLNSAVGVANGAVYIGPTDENVATIADASLKLNSFQWMDVGPADDLLADVCRCEIGGPTNK